MKSREISRSKIGPFSLACTDPYIGIGWENQSRRELVNENKLIVVNRLSRRLVINRLCQMCWLNPIYGRIDTGVQA